MNQYLLEIRVIVHLVLGCFLFQMNVVSGVSSSRSFIQSCSSKNTCESCYTMQGCQWCSNQDAVYECISSTESCLSVGDVLLCDNDEGGNANRVSISRAIIKLNEGDAGSFQFAVQNSANFPLDFYMLMDLSYSLLNDIAGIRAVSNDIVNLLANFSANSLVGLGTFVDKLTLPFVADYMLNTTFIVYGVRSSCSGSVCARPFSYVHNVNLTANTSQFTSEINALIISTNVDNPEGTFDAISQAVLCKDVVGWRNNSVKILFVVTDNAAHMAGDGRLAGIVKPNVQECRTIFDTNTDSYTYVDNAEFDYPSPGEIRDLLSDNGVIPIFAVLSSDFLPYYEKLSALLETSGSQVVNFDSGVITAIELAYKNIVSNVALKYTIGRRDEVDIKVVAVCPEGATLSADKSSCSNVTTGQTITFTVDVILNKCTEEFQSGSRVILINIPGYGQFDLEVQGLCT